MSSDAVSIKAKSWEKCGFSLTIPNGATMGDVLDQAIVLLAELKSYTWITAKAPYDEGMIWYVYCKEAIIEEVDKIVAPYGLHAEILGDRCSVGVGGDERSYTLTVNLIGVFPGNEVLARLSSEISSTLPINRVTFQLSQQPL